MQAPAVLAQTYTLPADTLFAFDRSDRAGMTDAGTRAIDMLLSRLQNDYSRIDRVHLIGHADPLGLPERNERLAIERAQTVRDYITQTGQLQVPLTAEGRGSREPVVRYCGNSATAQAIACNLPNRRVAVQVTGVRR
jgi:outer membrane protein OmpA-like peptidoglycan-associated protein